MKINKEELEKRFVESANDVFGFAEIIGQMYSQISAIKKIDPNIYDNHFQMWIDLELDNGSLFELPNGEYSDEFPIDEENDDGLS